MATFDVENAPRTSLSQPQGRSSASSGRRSTARSTLNSVARLSIAAFVDEQDCDEARQRDEAMSGKDAETSVACAQGLSSAETTANLVIFAVGGAILVLPKVLAEAGTLSGTGLMMIAFFCVYESGCLVVACCDLVETQVRAVPGTVVESFEVLAGEIGGPLAKIGLTMTKNVYLIGLLIIYGLLLRDGLRPFHSFSDPVISWCFIFPFFAFMAMIKDLKQVKRFSGLGMCCAFLQVGLLGSGAIARVFAEDYEFKMDEYDLVRGDALTMGNMMATCFYACGSLVCTVPGVRNQMEKKEEFVPAFKKALIIVFCGYMSVMSIVYGAYGKEMKGTTLESINSNCFPIQCGLGTVAAVALCCNLSISIPNICYFVISFFESLGDSSLLTTWSTPNLIGRVLLICCTNLTGSVVPYVGEVIGILSASFGVFNCLAWPLILYYLKPASRDGPGSAGKILRDRVVHLGIAFVACVTMSFGVAGALAKLQQEMEMANFIPAQEAEMQPIVEPLLVMIGA